MCESIKNYRILFQKIPLASNEPPKYSEYPALFTHFNGSIMDLRLTKMKTPHLLIGACELLSPCIVKNTTFCAPKVTKFVLTQTGYQTSQKRLWLRQFKSLFGQGVLHNHPCLSVSSPVCGLSLNLLRDCPLVFFQFFAQSQGTKRVKK